jgi:hypothetical protein
MCQRVSPDAYSRGQPYNHIHMIWNCYTGGEVVLVGLGVVTRSYGQAQNFFG